MRGKPIVLALPGLAVAWAIACGGGESSGVGSAKMPEGVRSSNIDHEACSEAGHKVEVLDTNNDGKPDIKRVYDGSGKETCRIVDMNHDGKPDMYEYFDASGQVRRRELDLGDEGVVNVVEYYEGGKLARKELDTSRRGKIDTWDFFDVASGKRTKRERDTNGDGRVDQWWTWEGEKITIAMDKNFDGQPEIESQVVLGDTGGGKDGGPALPVAGEAGAPAEPTPAPAPTPAATDGPSNPPTDAGAPRDGGSRRNRGGKK